MKTKSLLAAILLLFCATSLWASNISIDGIYYDFDDSNMTASVTFRGDSNYEYKDEYSGNVFIPSTVSYGGKTYSVTSIGDDAFRNCSGLLDVSIPNSVTSIGNGAFYQCSGLTSVTIPNSVTSIGGHAFQECTSLTSVTIPNSVTSIGNGAFSYCSSLTSVIISNSVTNIGDYTFYNCHGLTSVTIPNSVTNIGDYTFYNCHGLTSVTIPNSVTTIGKYAFSYCSGLTSVTIPNSVTTIGASAFERCIGLTSVIIPNSVTSIGDDAFRNCSGLLDVSIPNSVTSIGAGAFRNCTSITSVAIGNGVKILGVNAFRDCTGLTNVVWNVKSLSDFSETYSPFYYSREQITSFVLGKDVEYIPAYLCYGMKQLTSFDIPGNVTKIGNYAFAGIDNRQFKKLVLPHKLVMIGTHAFDGASYLQAIHFGAALEEIGEQAFNGCTRVKEMTCLAEIAPTVGKNGLTSINKLAELYVPDDYLFEYQIANDWKRFVLKPLGATEATVSTNAVKVEADDNTATFTWPINDAADSYTIEITKDGVVFCTLTFNANGQLTGIAFAPSRDGQTRASEAAMTAAGMQFTITGLNSGTNYSYSLTAKEGSTVLASYSGGFATTGTSADITGLDNSTATTAPQKVLRDGKVLILREGKTYTVQGHEVK